MADQEWYYSREDEQLGPVPKAELQQMLDTGKLKPDELVWCDGMDDWLPAAEVPGLVTKTKSAKPAKGPKKAAKKAPKKVGKKGEEESKSTTATDDPPTDDATDKDESGAGNGAPHVEVKPGDARPDDKRSPREEPGDEEIRLPQVGPTDQPASRWDDTPEVGPPEPAAAELPAVSSPARRTMTAPANSPATAMVDRGPKPSRFLSLIQLVVWFSCGILVLVGSPFFVEQWNAAETSADKTSTAAAFLVLFVAAYALARSGERIAQLLDQLRGK